MNKMKRIASLICFSVLSLAVSAQENAAEPTDVMKTNGKIYVVMAVVIVIVLGLFIYLISLDRKISRLEKE